jgi:hypothetical protein
MDPNAARSVGLQPHPSDRGGFTARLKPCPFTNLLSLAAPKRGCAAPSRFSKGGSPAVGAIKAEFLIGRAVS